MVSSSKGLPHHLDVLPLVLHPVSLLSPLLLLLLIKSVEEALAIGNSAVPVCIGVGKVHFKLFTRPYLHYVICALIQGEHSLVCFVFNAF